MFFLFFYCCLLSSMWSTHAFVLLRTCSYQMVLFLQIIIIILSLFDNLLKLNLSIRRRRFSLYIILTRKSVLWNSICFLAFGHDCLQDHLFTLHTHFIVLPDKWCVISNRYEISSAIHEDYILLLRSMSLLCLSLEKFWKPEQEVFCGRFFHVK